MCICFLLPTGPFTLDMASLESGHSYCSGSASERLWALGIQWARWTWLLTVHSGSSPIVGLRIPHILEGLETPLFFKHTFNVFVIFHFFPNVCAMDYVAGKSIIKYLFPSWHSNSGDWIWRLFHSLMNNPWISSMSHAWASKVNMLCKTSVPKI